jgi:hypothetical protein
VPAPVTPALPVDVVAAVVLVEPPEPAAVLTPPLPVAVDVVGPVPESD